MSADYDQIFHGIALAKLTNCNCSNVDLLCYYLPGNATPLPQAVDVPETDKWHHFVAFAALTYPLIVASRRYWILIIIIGFSFGALIKIIQPYVNMVSNFYDFTADAFGVLIRFSLGLVVHNLKLKAAVLDDS